jgi:hypothetical protein
MGRGWWKRRTVAVVLVACAGAALLALGLSAVPSGDAAPSAATALPLHPVVGTFEPDATRIEDCSDQACLEQAYGNLAFRSGPQTALGRLDAEIGSSTNACHRIAHIIGAASLARFHGDVARTLANGSATCSSGYYHGTLERSLVGVRSRGPAALGGVARELCAGPELRAQAELAYQCLHGLGHGLMITMGYDLPVALGVCDRLAGEWETSSCNGGVFMENMSTAYGFRSSWLRDDDLVYPCDAVAEEDKLTCYQLVTSRIVQAIGLEWERIAEICASVERAWVSACFESFGRDVAGQTHRDPGEIVEVCAVARPYGGEDECIAFAALDVLGNDPSGRQAIELCSRAEHTRVRRGCLRAVGGLLGRASPTRAAGLARCSSLVPATPDRTACGTGVEDHFGAGADS